MLEAGLRHIDVAEHLGMSCGNITHLAAHYRVHGTVDDLHSSGRPPVTTPVQGRHIRMSHIRDHFFYWQRQLLWLLQVVRMTK